MKKVFLLACIMAFAACNVQQKVTETEKISAYKNKNGDLIGVANKESFQQIPYSTWFNKKYDTYTPDSLTITSLKKELKGIEIKGFMGTWCGDSKRETPHFYKILEQTDFNLNNLELITVNISKKTPDNLQEGFNIKRVPTFIFYRDGKEIGRYVEYARESLEKDILKIVSGKEYKHSYDN
ncbi:thioredoxin family protein [Polaribacter atrinae]|uniref:thioredoxin family protein n=1 Tax=Polaribacter atrinae TaxID=1333662 RepID=UPI002491E1BF|nr:thioredoxin family protein [Polaribacter atrinae]